MVFARSWKAKLLAAGLVGFFFGYTVKSGVSSYAIASSPSGTFKMDTVSGKVWILVTDESGKSRWVAISQW